MIPRIALVGLLALIAGLLVADIHAHGAAARQSQAEMTQQAYRSYQQADRRLNAVYKKLMGVLEERHKKRLVTAQKAWLMYRDAHAEFFSRAEAEGGTMEPMLYAMEEEAVTRQRTKILQDCLKALK